MTLPAIHTEPHSHIDRQYCYVIECTRIQGEFKMARTENLPSIAQIEYSGELAIGMLIAALTTFDPYSTNPSPSVRKTLEEMHVDLLDKLTKATEVKISYRVPYKV